MKAAVEIFMTEQNEREPARDGHTDRRAALSDLVYRLWPWLRRKAQRFVRPGISAIGPSSLMQETLLRFTRSIDKVKAKDLPKTQALLKRILANVASDAQRSMMRQKRDVTRLPVAQIPSESASQHESRVSAQDELRWLHRAIARLPARQRQVIEWTLQEQSPPQIAQALGSTVGTVHMLLNRAKAQLAQFRREDALREDGH